MCKAATLRTVSLERAIDRIGIAKWFTKLCFALRNNNNKRRKYRAREFRAECKQSCLADIGDQPQSSFTRNETGRALLRATASDGLSMVPRLFSEMKRIDYPCSMSSGLSLLSIDASASTWFLSSLAMTTMTRRLLTEKKTGREGKE